MTQALSLCTVPFARGPEASGDGGPVSGGASTRADSLPEGVPVPGLTEALTAVGRIFLVGVEVDGRPGRKVSRVLA